jgi:KDO2-lipid IV(A) lauroyltransferase
MEYAAVRALAFIASSLGHSARLKCAKAFGWFAAHVAPVARARILTNLEIAFPEWTEEERRKLLPQVYENGAALAFEALSVGRLTKGEIEQRIDAEAAGLEKFKALQRDKKGVVLLSGHFGAWEWGWLYLIHEIGDVMAVMKHLHNPLVDNYIWNVRHRLGLKSQFVSDGMKPMFKHLRAGKILGIMPDQDARNQGIFVPFFGKPASTATGPAWMAYHLGVPLVMGSILRAPGGKYSVHFEEPIWADPNAPEEAEIERLTRLHTALLERTIRQNPAQYFWFHRRWKTQPKASNALETKIAANVDAKSTEGAVKA